jgi:hypothetical protein
MMSSISSPPSDTTNAVWTKGSLEEPQSKELPKVLADESVQNYGTMNVRPLFAKLAVELENRRDGKISMKNQEMRELRNQLSTLTDFLDKANYQMLNTTGDKIHMENDADLLFKIKETLPEHARNLLGDSSIIERRKLEWLCQMVTRRIDSEVTPKIDEIKDDIVDIMQLLDKMLPILKDLLKKCDDQINYTLRQPK